VMRKANDSVLLNCTMDEFECASTGTCIAWSDVCDNITQCDDVSDDIYYYYYYEAFCIDSTSALYVIIDLLLYPPTQILTYSSNFGVYTTSHCSFTLYDNSAVFSLTWIFFALFKHQR